SLLPYSFMRLRLAGIVRGLALPIRRTSLATALARARVVGKELVDDALQHDRRLCLIDIAAVLEEGVGTSRAEADVLAAEQSLGLDAGVAVIGNLVVLRIEAHRYHRLEVLGIEADRRHLAEAHTRHGDRGPHLEVADVIESRRHVKASLGAAKLQAA